MKKAFAPYLPENIAFILADRNRTVTMRKE
jgi:hypothetical protein